jgi:WD40 repeat protein
MTNIDRYYEILGLQPGVSEAEVKQAYRKLAKQWHPDRFASDPQLKKQAEEKFKLINEAYEQLREYLPGFQKQTVQTKYYTSNQDYAEFYYQQGVQEAEKENYHEAIQNFSYAIKLNIYYVEAYQYRGFIRDKLGLRNAANADFRKARELKLKYKQNPANTATYSADRESTRSVDTSPKFNCQCRQTLRKHTNSVASVAIDKNSNIIVSGSYDGTIKIWHLATGKLIRSIDAHTDRINCIAIEPDGKTIVSASSDKTVKLWQLNSGKLINTFGGWFSGHSNQVLCLTFSKDGQKLLTGSADRTVKLWQVNTGKELDTLTGYSGQVLSLALSPDGNIFVSGGLEPYIRIRRITNGKLIRSLKINSGIFSLVFSPDGRLLATGGYDRTVRLWDVTNGNQISVFKGHKDIVSTVAFSPDGKTIASGSLDGKIKLWQVDTCREIGTIAGHSDGVLSLVFCDDGHTMISGSADRTIKIWHCNLVQAQDN